MKTVELLNAFLFTCDECGRDNFCRGITLAEESIDPDDLPHVNGVDPEDLREYLNAGGEGSWMTAPSKVTCGHCGEMFKVEDLA